MPSPTGLSAATTAPLSGNVYIDSLLYGTSWFSNTITYSFPSYSSYWSTDSYFGYGPQSSGREPWASSWAPLSAYDQLQFAAALRTWAAYANLTFVQVAETVASVGDIRASYTYQADQAGKVAWTYFPSYSASAGDVWFNAQDSSRSQLWIPGSYSYFVVLHELGHALGLKHPFEGSPVIPAAYDSQIYTIMSYSAVAGDQGSYLTYYPTTPMLYDIAAMQYLYGANTTTSGGTTYSYNDFRHYMETIWDSGGTDTISYSGSFASTIDLNQGHGSAIGAPVYVVSSTGQSAAVNNVWIAFGTDIENAFGGTGNDVITGNALANILNGGAGNDTIAAGKGDDVLIGGAGNDTIDGGPGHNIAYLSGTSAAYSTWTNGVTRFMQGQDGTDAYTNVDRFHFDNVDVAYDINGDAGQAYRLYQAAFNRAPDLAGLGYQMTALDNGLTLVQVANNFIASPEFQRTYGAVNDTQFVTLLYQNVLHRAPDPSGLQYHLNELEQWGESRAQVLTNFSESPENKANVIGAIQNGIPYTV